MPFPASQPFGDEMVARSEEDARNARGLQSAEERLVVRDHDRAVLRGEIEERIVRGCVAFHDPGVLREALCGALVPVEVSVCGYVLAARRMHRLLAAPA